MSAVYALGRNPSPAVQPLLQLLQIDSNAFVRKAAAWSLGNYPDAPVLNPLMQALQTDVAAVRLWCPGSLAEAGSRSASRLIPLPVSCSAVCASTVNPWFAATASGPSGDCEQLVPSRQQEIVEAIVESLLQDSEASVRDEARTALRTAGGP